MTESRSAPPPAPREGGFGRVSASPGMTAWMLGQGVSIAVTSYRGGRLLLVGVGPDGGLAFDQQDYLRAMGLCYADRRLYVASLYQIWRLENLLGRGEYANAAFDCVLVPRVAHTTGYLDVHDIAVDRAGRVLFVNTRHSCLATLDDRLSFRPVWKPPFISALAEEDRCHLNGLAMADGVPRYATAVAATDSVSGWRAALPYGGLLIDIAADAIVTDQLSMPHSPRWHDGKLLVLDSGRGELVTIDPATGTITPIVFCPGFLRGMALHGDYALVATSLPRGEDFGVLPLQDALARSDTAPVCGLFVIDLRRGAIVEFLRFDGGVQELFDVAALPGIRNPSSYGPGSEAILGGIRFDPAFAPLAP